MLLAVPVTLPVTLPVKGPEKPEAVRTPEEGLKVNLEEAVLSGLVPPVAVWKVG